MGKNVISICAKDSARDIQTQTLSVDISDNQIHKSSNLPGELNVCIVAKVMLTVNINTPNSLINGSTGKIEHVQIPTAGNNLLVIIYVKFDDVDACNSLKNNRLRDELKESVPIIAITKTFPFRHKSETVTVQQK